MRNIGSSRRAGVLAVLASCALASTACDTFQPGGPAPGGYGNGYGYGPPPPPPGEPPPASSGGFSPSEFAWSEGDGPGSLIGRVAYHSQAGERWTCAGQTIALIPATRYSAQRMGELYGSRSRAVLPASEVRARSAAQPGVDYGRYVRTAACDAHDAFSFARFPAGTYFLIARARPHGHAAGPNDGVVVMERVDLSPGPTRLIVPPA